ncbi:hypothetical protein [Fodinicola acaciae]|uniref:hypothetical protein n=1 Tax=Fodinicola acaciae TaxID=2681555 RepID=UPI0013D0617C|nr:hypothetical protein [Fodinicola acaciae]
MSDQRPPEEPPSGDPYAHYPGPGLSDPNDPLVAGDYSGWWSRGLELAKRTWQQILVLEIALVVLTLLLVTPISVWRLTSIDLTGRGTANPGFQLGSSLLQLAATVVTAVIGSVIGLVAVHLVAMAAANERPALGVALQRAARRMPHIVLWALVFGALAFVGFIACVVPGLYVGLVSLLLPSVVAFERDNPLSRAFSLFNQNFGLALGFAATIYGLSLVASLIAGCLGGVAGVGAVVARSTGALIGGTILATLVSAVLAAAIGLLTYPLQVVAYATLRGRRTPVSTAQLVQELSQP